jgi:pSer/pThr/pTyr-binding forkhead associated (FHA) protein
MKPRIHIVGGSLLGQTVELCRNKLLIGRDVDCDLRPLCDFVSRHHCVLVLDFPTLRIRDLGSKNGTFLNGRRISASDVLVHGDLVSIGETVFVVDLSRQEREQTSQPHPKETHLLDTETVQCATGPMLATKQPRIRETAAETPNTNRLTSLNGRA